MPVLEAQIRQPGDEDWLDVEFDVVGSLVTIRAGSSVLGEYSTTDISWGGKGPFLMTIDNSTLSVRPADTDAFRRTLVNPSHPEASDSSIRASEISRVPDIASIIVVVLAAIVGAVLISGDHPFRDRNQVSGEAGSATPQLETTPINPSATPTSPDDVSMDIQSVRIGIANEIPYGYVDEDSGDVTGLAPEVARLVLDELGITIQEWVVVQFGDLIGTLQAGDIDVIAAGMYINPDRASQILFSDPDYCILESMLVPAGNPAGLTDYSSVANTDVRLAVASGTVNVDYARWAGIPDGQIVEFAGIEDQYDAIAAGRVDAVSGTSLTVERHAQVMDGFEALPPFPALDPNGYEILGCGGYGFRRQDRDLREAFNMKLNQLQREGVVQKIVEEVFGVPGLGEYAAPLTVEYITGG